MRGGRSSDFPDAVNIATRITLLSTQAQVSAQLCVPISPTLGVIRGVTTQNEPGFTVLELFREPTTCDGNPVDISQNFSTL